MKVRPVQPEAFETPEITVDTSVEAAVGSPANPATEPEPAGEEAEAPAEEAAVEGE